MITGPMARKGETLVPQQVSDEFVIYDLDTDRVHNLNSTAAAIWQWCDGLTPPEALIVRLAAEYDLSYKEAEPLLWLTLKQLDEAKLMENKVIQPVQYRGVSRRNVVKILAGASLLPVVYTIAAPSAAHAQSDCLGEGETGCTGPAGAGPYCCEGLTCVRDAQVGSLCQQ